MPAKMIRLVPLPTPRVVICSPSHIRNMVPPVSAAMVVMVKNSGLASTMWPGACNSPWAMPNDCTSASTTVR